MGRSAGKVESQDEELASLHRAYASLVGSSYGRSSSSPISRCAVFSESEYCKGRYGEVVNEVSSVAHVAAKPIESFENSVWSATKI